MEAEWPGDKRREQNMRDQLLGECRPRHIGQKWDANKVYHRNSFQWLRRAAAEIQPQKRNHTDRGQNYGGAAGLRVKR